MCAGNTSDAMFKETSYKLNTFAEERLRDEREDGERKAFSIKFHFAITRSIRDVFCDAAPSFDERTAIERASGFNLAAVESAEQIY